MLNRTELLASAAWKLTQVDTSTTISASEMLSATGGLAQLTMPELAALLDQVSAQMAINIEQMKHLTPEQVAEEGNVEFTEQMQRLDEACAEADEAHAKYEATAKRIKTISVKAKAMPESKVTVKAVGDSRFVGTTLEGQSFREAQSHVKATINQLNIKGVKASIKRMGYKATTPSGLVSIVNHIETILGYMTEADATAKTAIAKAEQAYELA